MPNMGWNPQGINEVNYGEKTSEYGHYQLADWGHAGTNKDGTKWKSQNMEWVEDNRKSEAPVAEPEPAAEPELTPEPKQPIEYSPEIQQAKERVANYENDVMSGKISDDIYGNDKFIKNAKPRQVTQSFLDKQKYQFLRK